MFCIASPQEAPGVWSTSVHLDRRSSYHNDLGCCGGDGHHQGNVRTLGHVQQLLGGERNHPVHYDLIPAADDCDRFLLLQNRLQTQKQGDFPVIMTVGNSNM